MSRGGQTASRTSAGFALVSSCSAATVQYVVFYSCVLYSMEGEIKIPESNAETFCIVIFLSPFVVVPYVIYIKQEPLLVILNETKKIDSF